MKNTEITQDVRDYAAEIEARMEERSREFREKGGEIHVAEVPIT